MPKVVDPAARRADVFDAVFRVIAAQGIDAATLSRVAQEADLAVGSVRHFLGTHSEMLASAAQEVRARITARLQTHAQALSEAIDQHGPLEQSERWTLLLDMLSELLPLDPLRQQETRVWLEFVVAARTRPEFAATTRAMFADLRILTARIAERAGLPASAGPRLAALLDGLALAGALHPDVMPAKGMRGVLAAELDALATEADPQP